MASALYISPSAGKPTKTGVYMVRYEYTYPGESESVFRDGYAWWSPHYKRWGKACFAMRKAAECAYMCAPVWHTNQNLAWKVLT